MATFQWVTADAIATALSTGLNSLGSGATSAASATISNSSGLLEYITLELVLASLIPTGTPSVDVLMVLSVDGTNFADLLAANTTSYLTSFGFSTATAAKRCAVYGLVIPPLDFQLALVNNAGVAFAASGNTLKYRRYNEDSV